MTTITSEQFKGDLLVLMTETFESVLGIYLDKGTSLFETLAQISAAEASIPVGGKCATLAAQTAHVCFYLDVTEQYVRTGQNQDLDWGEVWRTVGEVSPEEWSALQQRLKESYQRIRKTLESYDNWDVEYSLAGAMGVVVHTAYHLGEIRQATCTLKP